MMVMIHIWAERWWVYHHGRIGLSIILLERSTDSHQTNTSNTGVNLHNLKVEPHVLAGRVSPAKKNQ